MQGRKERQEGKVQEKKRDIQCAACMHVIEYTTARKENSNIFSLSSLSLFLKVLTKMHWTWYQHRWINGKIAKEQKGQYQR